MRHPRLLQQGFSLIEIAIVLVIIGLLVGSVIVGRDLYITARDRSIIKESNSYKQAVEAFYTKYNQLPGDMLKPGNFWPSIAWSGNGNGDGTITWGKEGPEAWIQLQQAGFIGGSFTLSCSTNCPGSPDVNIPRSSAIYKAGWTIGYNGRNGVNALIFGGYDSATLAVLAVIGAKEAYYIDSKIDDGDPSTGNMQSRNNFGNATNCLLTTDTYNLNTTDPACNFDIAIGL